MSRAGKAAGALSALAIAYSAFAFEVPYLGGRVNDHARMMAPETRERLEEKLRAHEQRTTHQVAILTVKSLDGGSLEEVAMRVAETWKLGAKEKDNGVLLLIARDERKMRLEVGYGLESVVTDAVSRRILDERVRPRFRVGDFSGGMEAGVDALLRVLDGQPLPEAPGPGARATPLSARLLAFAVFALVIGAFSLVAAVGPAAPGWFLYVFLLPFWAAFPSALVRPGAGVALAAAWLVGLPIVRVFLHRSGAGKRFLARHSGLRGFATSAGRGGLARGGSGRGGFSGGGGGFGGGGASSGW